MKNKALAIKAIKKDCQLQFRYLNSNGLTCAIGCLALLAGVSKAELEAAAAVSINNQDQPEAVRGIASKITNRFGLSLRRLAKIQKINDADDFDVAERRAAIVKYLKSI